jgi:hypothetical protein
MNRGLRGGGRGARSGKLHRACASAAAVAAAAAGSESGSAAAERFSANAAPRARSATMRRT